MSKSIRDGIRELIDSKQEGKRYKTLKFIGKRMRTTYKWISKQRTVDWAEENIVFNGDTSPITGALDLSRSPHIIEMLDDFDKTRVWKQIGNYSTQTGKTLWLFIAVGKTLDADPCKIQFAIPNEDAVSNYIEDKAEPFMRGVKSLTEKMEVHADNEKGLRKKKTRIRVPNGDCTFTGSSASSKRSRTVRVMAVDEMDLMVDGSFIELEGRTKAFEKFDRKVLGASSQKRENGEIGKAYKTCETKKEWQTRCKQCNHTWYAGSKHFKWITRKQYAESLEIEPEDIVETNYKTEALKDVHLLCPHCDHHISSEEKDNMILDGQYLFKIVEGDENGRTIGYKGNALAMFLTTFETIAGLVIDAESSEYIEDIQQVYLDYFNEIYKAEHQTTDENDILLLSNGLDERILHEDTAIVLMGIDTQKDHFWYEIRAYRYGIISDTILHGRVETFDDLEKIMGMNFECKDGSTRGIDKVGIDRRGIKSRTAEVDAWVTDLVVSQGMEDFIYLTEGERTASTKPIRMKTVVDDIITKKKKKYPLKAIALNNTVLKNELSASINRGIKKANALTEEDEGSEYFGHLFYINEDIVKEAEAILDGGDKWVSTNYWKQYTAESYIYVVNKQGKLAKEKSWENTRQTDNHYWDCGVICVALAHLMHISTMKKEEEIDIDGLMDLIPN